MSDITIPMTIHKSIFILDGIIKILLKSEPFVIKTEELAFAFEDIKGCIDYLCTHILTIEILFPHIWIVDRSFGDICYQCCIYRGSKDIGSDKDSLTSITSESDSYARHSHDIRLLLHAPGVSHDSSSS